MPLKDPVARAKYLQDYYKKNREIRDKQSKEWYDKHPERVAEYGKKFRKNNKEKVARWGRKWRLKKAEKLAGRPKPSVCEVCNKPGKICFDHCHVSNDFRGWLCNKCNVILGLANDDSTVLKNLASYLERKK